MFAIGEKLILFLKGFKAQSGYYLMGDPPRWHKWDKNNKAPKAAHHVVDHTAHSKAVESLQKIHHSTHAKSAAEMVGEVVIMGKKLADERNALRRLGEVKRDLLAGKKPSAGAVEWFWQAPKEKRDAAIAEVLRSRKPESVRLVDDMIQHAPAGAMDAADGQVSLFGDDPVVAGAGGDAGHAEGDKWVQPLDAAIQEHQELVQVATTPTKVDDKVETEQQKVELGRMEAARAEGGQQPAPAAEAEPRIVFPVASAPKTATQPTITPSSPTDAVAGMKQALEADDAAGALAAVAGLTLANLKTAMASIGVYARQGEAKRDFLARIGSILANNTRSAIKERERVSEMRELADRFDRASRTREIALGALARGGYDENHRDDATASQAESEMTRIRDEFAKLGDVPPSLAGRSVAAAPASAQAAPAPSPVAEPQIVFPVAATPAPAAEPQPLPTHPATRALTEGERNDIRRSSELFDKYGRKAEGGRAAWREDVMSGKMDNLWEEHLANVKAVEERAKAARKAKNDAWRDKNLPRLRANKAAEIRAQQEAQRCRSPSGGAREAACADGAGSARGSGGAGQARGR